MKYLLHGFPGHLSILFILVTWGAYPCAAEIYKYQDEYGNWIYTDKPPDGQVVPKASVGEKVISTPSRDLAKELHEEYQPSSPAGLASLAVVGIHNPPVQGSGFFISADGFLLTNKHIIKPTETNQWKDLQKQLAETKKAYKQASQILRNENDRLKEMERALKNYRVELDRANGSMSEYSEAEYQYYRDRYLRHKKDYSNTKKDYKLSKKEYEKARREFNIQSSASVLRKDFKIDLKNGSEITARLVALSDSTDLALLKVDHYHTPYIEPGDSKSLKQGDRVFAIGNPLGMKDVMSSGVVAGLKEEYVLTDATVLPGSSGGPLITLDGKVVGITSIRVSQVIGGEGFGAAIIIESAMSEFSKFIKIK